MNNIEIGEPFLSWTETITEPEFEFDESDLHSSIQCNEPDSIIKDEILNQELSDEINNNSIFFTSKDENYEDQIPKHVESLEPQHSDDCSLSRYNIINISGDDKYGRKIIIVSACNLPPRQKLNYDEFSRYIKVTLDQFVEVDYVLVYFHFGLTGRNKPPISWLWQTYKMFDRNYKKNLKQLYLVHPTNFVKIFYQIFKKAISSKFGDKIIYVKTLRELQPHMYIEQIYIPKPVLEHDHELYISQMLSYEQAGGGKTPGTPLNSESITTPPPTSNDTTNSATLNIHRYTTSPEYLRNLIYDLIQIMSNDQTLTTIGLFRRSCNMKHLKKCKSKLLNEGANIKEVIQDDENDVHLRAVLLKTLLRTLPDPIFNAEIYDKICNTDVDHQDVNFCREIVENLILPEDYEFLKRFIGYLALVASFEQINKMNCTNLGLIFGPNFVWSRDQPSLQSLYRINHFVTVLIKNYNEIFTT